jgi:putative membrane protein
MKKIMLNSFLAIALSVAFAACDSGQKSNNDANSEAMETAKDANEATEDAMEDNHTNAGTTADNADASMDEDSFEDAADFAMKAADAGMFEVEAGKLAAQKASAANVKSFAERMVKDHTKANNELKALAAKKKITLPAMVSKKHQDKLDKLAKLSGTDFDEEYMEIMDKDHEKDVKLFEKASESNDIDAEVKAFAAKTLPTLRMHAEMADSGEEMAEKHDMDTIGISKKNRN